MASITTVKPRNIDITGDYVVNSISATGNVAAGNIKSDNLLYSNGSPYVFTTNAAGSNTQVQFNDNNSFAGSANLVFNKTTGTLTAVYFNGDGSNLSSVTGSNVTGQVANALVAGTVYSNAQPNITSIGTLTDLSVTGNVSTSSYLLGNGAYITGLPAGYSNANVAAYLPTYSGNVSAAYFIGNGSTLTSITGSNVVGNVSDSVHAYFADVANSVSGSNVTGQVANALVAGTVYSNAQPNITSLGTLTALGVTGNIDVTGNINVTGNLNYSNVTNLEVGDPLIYIGANNTGNLYDLGIVASYNDGTYQHTGIARNHNNGTWTVFDDVVAEPTTVIDWANATLGSFKTGNIDSTNATLGNLVTANYFSGNGSLLTSIAGANVTGTVANANYASYSGTSFNVSGSNVSGDVAGANHANVADVANSVSGSNVTGQVANALVASTVYSNAQPNITSVGTLTSINVTGNVSSSGNIIGNGQYLTSINGSNVTGQVANSLVAGTVYTNAQPNITSVGTLSSLTISGNVTTGNANVLGTLTVPTITTSGPTGNITGANYISANYFSGTLTTQAQPNITSVGTLTSLSVSGNITASYFIGNGSQLTGLPASYSNANVAAYLPTYTGNFTAGNVSVTGNITGAYILGNGSQLTGLPASYSNANVQAYLPTYTGNFTAGNVSVSGNLTTNSANILVSLTVPSITTSGTTGNITGANYISANYFSGNGSLLSSLVGSNVTGQVGNALIAGTVYTAAQPNITSVGTLSSLTVSGLITATAGGIKVGNLQDTSGTNTIQLLNSNVSVTGSIVAGTGGTGNVTATYFIGNGSSLTSITGSNVTGQVGNALVSGTVYTGAQPNITSVGTLQGASVTGNLNITGNINVTGNLNYSNVTDLIVGDPLIYLGANNTGNLYDLGIVASYNDGTYQHTGLARDHSDGVWKLFTGVSTEPTTVIDWANATYAGFKAGNITAGNVSSTGNITAAYFIGNGSQLTGLPAGYSNANVASYLPTYTGNVSANYFIGDGSTLTSITGANVTGYVALSTTANTAGTVTTAAQPNITSLGTLSSVSVTANVTAGNIKTDNLLYANGTPWSFGSGGGSTGVAVGAVQVFTANGTGNTFTLTTTPSNEDQITVNIDGVLQLHSSFSLSGNVVTLDGTPVNGAVVEITNYNSGGAAGSNTQVQYNDGGNIAGSAGMTFDKTTGTLNANIVTANGTPLATTGKAIAMAIVFGF